jgi:hypothetical protein
VLDDRRHPAGPHHLFNNLTTLFLGVREAEVEVEVRGRRGHPGKAPAHPALVRLQLLERRLGHECERHVAGVQVREDAVDRVGDRRVDRAARFVARAEHEVVDEELRSPLEELAERLSPLGGVKSVVLVHRHPGQLTSLLGKLVTDSRVLLFADE